MKFPNIKTLLIAGLLVGVSNTAIALDFTGDEAAQNAAAFEPSPVHGILKEGIKLYGQKNYFEAAQKFYAVIKNQSSNPAMDKDIAEAQFHLAMTLYKLKLYQSSLDYFDKIASSLDTSEFGPQALTALADLSKELGDDPNLGKILKSYSDSGIYDLKSVRKDFQDEYAFLVGRSYIQMGCEKKSLSAKEDQKQHAAQDCILRFQKAAALLEQVKKSSPQYAQAQYMLGVCNAKLDNLKKAMKNFRASLDVLKNKTSSLSYDEKRFLELNHLAIARIFYAYGNPENLKKALMYYSKIDRTSSNWPVALYEAAWTYIRLNNFDKALSNLQTVNSPFFSDRYFPQAPKIAALVYFYNCRYDRVTSILDDFQFEYELLMSTLDNIRNYYGKEYLLAFNWLVNAKNKGVDKQLERVVDSAFSDLSIRRSLDKIVALQQELEKFSELPEDFQTSPFGEKLKQDLTVLVSLTQVSIGEMVDRRLKDVSNEISQLLNDVKRINTQINAEKQRELSKASVAIDSQVAAAEKKDSVIKTNDQELVWTFDGEYWRDELGYYVVRVESQCKR